MTPAALGALVHYVMPDGTCRPGFVTKVITPAVCNLRVLLDGRNDWSMMNDGEWRPNCTNTQLHGGEMTGSWHYPALCPRLPGNSR